MMQPATPGSRRADHKERREQSLINWDASGNCRAKAEICSLFGDRCRRNSVAVKFDCALEFLHLSLVQSTLPNRPFTITIETDCSAGYRNGETLRSQRDHSLTNAAETIVAVRMRIVGWWLSGF